jgi:hypothetical protein
MPVRIMISTSAGSGLDESQRTANRDPPVVDSQTPPDRERNWAVPANLPFTFGESEYSSESVNTQPGERQVREKPTNFSVAAAK